MSRHRVTLDVPAEDLPRAEALLTLAGADTISLRDAADDPVLEPAPGTAPVWPNVTVEALFAPHVDVEALRALLATAFPGMVVAVDAFDEAGWQTRCRQPIEARPIGARLWLAPADHGHAPGNRRTLRLNMGLAFGTGEHPTTALCLEWLERHVARGTTVLDYGCGSGILALAAVTLGARFAYAVDNDTQALSATNANAELNGAAARLFVGTPESLPAVTVDVLVANILAGPLVALAPVFAKRVVPNGTVVLSGILESQTSHVASAYAPYLADISQVTRDGWARLAGRRKAG